MAKLRIEFSAVGSGRGRLGGQVDAREAELLGTIALPVTETPTAAGDRPVVPEGEGTVFATLAASDAAVYVAVGTAPDASAEPRLLVVPGRPELVHVRPGHAIAAVLAGDVPAWVGVQATAPVDRSGNLAAGGAAQTACPAHPQRRLLVVANPDEHRPLWFSTTGSASGGGGSILVGPGGAVIFDRVVPSGAVSIYGAATGQPFTVQEV